MKTANAQSTKAQALRLANDPKASPGLRARALELVRQCDQQVSNDGPPLSAHQQQLLAKFDRSPETTRVEGTSLILAPMTEAQARAKMQQMIAEGRAPGGPGPDFARIANTEFKVRGGR
jgi:hypothetical protein